MLHKPETLLASEGMAAQCQMYLAELARPQFHCRSKRVEVKLKVMKASGWKFLCQLAANQHNPPPQTCLDVLSFLGWSSKAKL